MVSWDINGNFHTILDADWLWCLVAMVVTIQIKVTINSKVYATGAQVTAIRAGFRLICIPGGPKKTEQSIQSIFQDFALINSYLCSPCWIEHLFPHYNNTKIIKFG